MPAFGDYVNDNHSESVFAPEKKGKREGKTGKGNFKTEITEP